MDTITVLEKIDNAIRATGLAELVDTRKTSVVETKPKVKTNVEIIEKVSENIVIDKNNTIVAGHTRYKASLELGLEEVPCIIADDLNEEQMMNMLKLHHIQFAS